MNSTQELKESFIKRNTTGECEDYNKNVITFISEIAYHGGEQGEDVIHDLFRAGYCYWFANMLKMAFGRGRLCMTYPFGHIVWEDEDGLAYDIEGAYLLDEHECEELIPMDFFGDIAYDFMHIPNKEYHASKSFHEWADFMKMTDTYAATTIFLNMPKDGIDYENDDFDTVVHQYWIEHQQELQEKYWEHRKNKAS